MFCEAEEMAIASSEASTWGRLAVTEYGIAGKAPANISGSDSPSKHQPLHILWVSQNAPKVAQPSRVTTMQKLRSQFETSWDSHDLKNFHESLSYLANISIDLTTYESSRHICRTLPASVISDEAIWV